MKNKKRLFLDVARVLAIKDERLRNFILCTRQEDKEARAMIEVGRPDLFSDRPLAQAPLSGLLIATFGKVLSPNELIHESDTILDCEQHGVPIVKFLTYEDEEETLACPIWLEDTYNKVLEIIPEEECRDLPVKAIGDKLVYQGNCYVVVGRGHANDYIALAPASMIDLNS